MKDDSWWIFKGSKKLSDRPDSPSWRFNKGSFSLNSGRFDYIFDEGNKENIDIINSAIYLRKPLVITGEPGVGKSSFAYYLASSLGLNLVKWSINSESSVKKGLYEYDILSRLNDSQLWQFKSGTDKDQLGLKSTPKIENYLSLGPLGTAYSKDSKDDPYVLLIDEMDKGKQALESDLLDIIESNEFFIPELARLGEQKVSIELYGRRGNVDINSGHMTCGDNPPIVIFTANDEYDFSSAFRRRCLFLELPRPDKNTLLKIVRLISETADINDDFKKIVDNFIKEQADGDKVLSVDQLLGAIEVARQSEEDIESVCRANFQDIGI